MGYLAMLLMLNHWNTLRLDFTKYFDQSATRNQTVIDSEWLPLICKILMFSCIGIEVHAFSTLINITRFLKLCVGCSSGLVQVICFVGSVKEKPLPIFIAL